VDPEVLARIGGADKVAVEGPHDRDAHEEIAHVGKAQADDGGLEVVHRVAAVEVDGIGDLEDLGGQRRVRHDDAEEVAGGRGRILGNGERLQRHTRERREVAEVLQVLLGG